MATTLHWGVTESKFLPVEVGTGVAEVAGEMVVATAIVRRKHRELNTVDESLPSPRGPIRDRKTLFLFVLEPAPGLSFLSRGAKGRKIWDFLTPSLPGIVGSG